MSLASIQKALAHPLFVPNLKHVFFAMLLCFSTFSIAHTKFESSTPYSGQRLTQSPGTLTLNFKAPVKLMKVTLSKTTDSSDPIPLSTGKETAKTHTLAVPNLGTGNYRVDWTYLGADTHTLKGKMTFSIKDDG